MRRNNSLVGQRRRIRVRLRLSHFVHKWSSLVCTPFLLMLCLTGLPLIFHEEIDSLSKVAVAPSSVTDRHLSLDTIVATARERQGGVGLFVSFDEDRPVVNVTTGATPDVAEPAMHFASYDWRTGRAVGAAEEPELTEFLLQLHTDMFLGLPGMLFLGTMGLCFFVALVSGIVLYAPLMRHRLFGSVRVARGPKRRWLDYHNLLGIVVLAWASVVGLTGVINTLSQPIFKRWQTTELASLTARYDDTRVPAPHRLASLQAALDTVRAAAPDARPQFVAFPGGAFSSRHHYAVFLQGDTPLTKRLLTIALVDAHDGALTAVRPLPWYAQTLLMSQPLHFGDYGGLPLKLIWAALTLVTIVVLGSGLYLWLIGRASTAGVRRAYRAARGFAPVPAE